MLEQSFPASQTHQQEQQQQTVVNETPQLVETRLDEFARALESLEDCPALRQAQTKCPEIANDRAFHLMFLRTEVFDVPLAAARYAKHWQDRLVLWGADAAFEKLSLFDKDQVAASYGFLRTVAAQERIIYIAAGRLPKDRDIDSVCRVCLYRMLEALRNSPELQKQGAVVLLDFHGCTGYDKAFYERYGAVTNNSFPLRISMVGLVRPFPLMGVVVEIIKLFVKPKLRKRIHVIRGNEKLHKHTGIASVEILLQNLVPPTNNASPPVVA